jgi:hypothetical protein
VGSLIYCNLICHYKLSVNKVGFTVTVIETYHMGGIGRCSIVTVKPHIIESNIIIKNCKHYLQKTFKNAKKRYLLNFSMARFYLCSPVLPSLQISLYGSLAIYRVSRLSLPDLPDLMVRQLSRIQRKEVYGLSHFFLQP